MYLSRTIRARKVVSCALLSASISTNAAVNPRVQHHDVQGLHSHFWNSYAARSAKRSEKQEPHPIISAYKSNASCTEVNDDVPTLSIVQSQEDDKARILRQNARKDMFKHFRMSASSRAMKRGDGILSHYFSLDQHQGKTAPSTNASDGMYGYHSAVIDVDTARKARADFRNHYWASHQARKDIIAQREEVRPIQPQQRTKLPRNYTSPQAVYPEKHQNRLPLPTKLNDARYEFLGSFHQHSQRAMAITETIPPFKIVDVNKAWVDLCGYSREEAIGSTFKSLLQGPETNLEVAHNLASSLLLDDRQSDRNPEFEAILSNYRSDGRMFRNHVRVGPLKDEITGEITYFVGVFKNVDVIDSMDGGFYANA